MMMDLLQAQEINNSSLWKYICNELDYRIQAKVNKLKTCTVDEVVGLQHDIRALEAIMKLPEDVIGRETPE